MDLLILKAVSLGPLHGYAVLLRLEEITGGSLLVEQGALYHALFRLEERRFLKGTWGTSENGRRAKFYQLSAVGRRHLKTEQAGWERLVQAMSEALATKAGKV